MLHSIAALRGAAGLPGEFHHCATPRMSSHPSIDVYMCEISLFGIYDVSVVARGFRCSMFHSLQTAKEFEMLRHSS